MTTKKDLTIGEVTKDDLRRWTERISRQQKRERYFETKKRIQLLKLKIINNEQEKN